MRWAALLTALLGCSSADDVEPGSTLAPLGCEGTHGDPRLEYVYVVDTEGDTVTVVNPRSCTVAATLPVAPEPVMANASASGAWVFVGSAGDEPTLTLIETDRHTVVTSLPLPFAPEVMIFDAAHVDLWIANRQTGQVVLFDTIEQKLVADMQLEPGLATLSMSSGSPDWMAVTNPSGGFVQVIDPEGLREEARVDVGGTPLAIDYASASGRSYVCVDGEHPELLVLPTEGAGAHVISRRIELPAPCTDVHFENGRYGVAVLESSSQAAVIDTATDEIAAFVEVGDEPDTVSISGERAVIGNRGSRDVSIIDLEAFVEIERPIISEAAGGETERQLRDAMDENFVYATSPEDDTLVIIDVRDGTVRGRVRTGRRPGPVIVAGKAGGSCC